MSGQRGPTPSSKRAPRWPQEGLKKTRKKVSREPQEAHGACSRLCASIVPLLRGVCLGRAASDQTVRRKSFGMDQTVRGRPFGFLSSCKAIENPQWPLLGCRMSFPEPFGNSLGGFGPIFGTSRKCPTGLSLPP